MFPQSGSDVFGSVPLPHVSAVAASHAKELGSRRWHAMLRVAHTSCQKRKKQPGRHGYRLPMAHATAEVRGHAAAARLSW